MQAYCPDISLTGEISVSDSIQAMDCHINMAVSTGYDRLFGAGGAFAAVLTIMLTIYVALIGYGFMTGRTRLTMTMMSPRIMTMVLVLTFVSVWPAYHAVFYGLLMGGPDEVAAALLGERGSAVMNFAQNLDGLFVKFADIARILDPATAQAAAQHSTVQSGITVVNTAALGPRPMPVTLFWLSGLFLLGSTLGVLILTRLVLYLLLILGPVFILFALFPQTRGLFNGWIRTSLIFAMAPLFTVLGGTAAMMLFVPLIDSIGANPQAAVAQVQPMIILFMGSVIYCAFLFVLMWVAANLVKDWQATWREKPAADRVSAGAVINAAAQTAAFTSVVGQSTVADRYERTEPLVAAVSRDAGRGGSGNGSGAGTRTEVLGLYDPQGRGVQSTDRFSRVQGLGQRFRPGATRPQAMSSIPATPRPQDTPA
jgi:type IV secretion system protein VirB6